jgi:hypothetical protein
MQAKEGTDHTFTATDGRKVRAVLQVEWEDDRLFGLGTIWSAEYSQEPHRRDGESDGLLTLDEVKAEAVAAHAHRSERGRLAQIVTKEDNTIG